MLLIYYFNDMCNNIAASYLKFNDESIIVISFHTTEKGDLPNLSNISAG